MQYDRTGGMRLKTLFIVLGAGLIVGVFVAAVVASRIVSRGFSARDQPSTVEAVAARTMRRFAVPRSARSLANPVYPSDEVFADARAHFADHCAKCHANDGSGDTTIGQNLYPKAPDMRLAATQNLGDGELYYIITHGVPLTGMPAWGDQVVEQDDESWQLVLFIRHLPQLSADELKEMELYNPKGKMELDEEEEQGGAGASSAPHQHHH